MRTASLVNGSSRQREVLALETEVDTLRFELEETRRKMESEVAKAREEALGVMRATGHILFAICLCFIIMLYNSTRVCYAGSQAVIIHPGLQHM